MAWLYVPSTALRSVQVSEALNSDSDSPSENGIELCVTSSGTVTRRPVSWPAWRNRPYIWLLSGMIWSPSTLRRGADSWISSLRESRASRGASQGNRKAKTTSDGFGAMSSESFATYDLDSSTWRTSGDYFEADSTRSSETWPTSGTMRNGRCYERATWEPRIDAHGCSSWRGWITPTKSEPVRGTKHYYRGPENPTLSGQVEGGTWPTPHKNSHTGPGTEGRDGGPNLQTKADRWAIPTSRDYKDGAADAMGDAPTNSLFGRQAPRTNPRGDVDHGRQLANQVEREMWQTPPASPGFKYRRQTHQTERKEKLLPAQAEDTPFGRQAPRTNPRGDTSSNAGRRLNPRFVEWLMGVPIGWSNPLSKVGRTDYEAWVMRWSHYKQRLLSMCSQTAEDS